VNSRTPQGSFRHFVKLSAGKLNATHASNVIF
jgi:hypothetical protein